MTEASFNLIKKDMELTIPNILTLLRIPMLFGIVLLELLGAPNAYTWILVLFVLSMVSDFLDGYLARVLKQTSQFGKIADPLMDKFFIIGILMWILSVGILSAVHLPVILLLFLRELTITGMRGSSGLGADWFGKWKTTLLFVSILVLLVHAMLLEDYQFDVHSISWMRAVGIIALWMGCLFGLYSGIRYMKAWNQNQ